MLRPLWGHSGPFLATLCHICHPWPLCATLGHFGALQVLSRPLWCHSSATRARLENFGPIWGPLGLFGALWATLGCFGPQRSTQDQSGSLWATPGHLDHVGSLWVATLAHFGSTLVHFGHLWLILVHSGSFRAILGHSGPLWANVDHSELLWASLGNSWPF